MRHLRASSLSDDRMTESDLETFVTEKRYKTLEQCSKMPFNVSFSQHYRDLLTVFTPPPPAV